MQELIKIYAARHKDDPNDKTIDKLIKLMLYVLSAPTSINYDRNTKNSIKTETD